MKKYIFIFLSIFIYIYYYNTVCYGIKCINSTYNNICIQDDEYFFINKNYLFENFLFYPWWIKSLFFPSRNLFITDFENKKVLILNYTHYKNYAELDGISACFDMYNFRLDNIK